MRKSFAYIAITFVILQFTFGFFFFPNDKSGEFFGGVEKVEAATFEEDKAAGFAFADSLMDINGNLYLARILMVSRLIAWKGET